MIKTTESSLSSWLFEKGLTPQTVEKLTTNGFATRAAIEAMELADVQLMGIQPLAQARLLEKLLRSLCPEPQPQITQNHTETRTGRCQPQQTNQDDITQQLQAVFGTQGILKSTPVPPATGERIDLNPLSYLLPAQKPKYKDITDFVESAINADVDESVLSEQGGCQLLIRAGTKKVKLEQVSPMSWSAANIKILMELLREGTLKQEGIFDYLAYTVKVSELAGSFIWTSVLHFDRAYRKLQAQHQFRWGSDAPHLHGVHLKPRTPVTSKPKSA